MKNRFTICFVAAASFAASGCSHDAGSVPAPSLVTVAPAITRVDGLNFETGDRIGLTIACSSGVYKQNEPMDYDGSVFASAGLAWHETGESATLTAYYPYDATAVPTEFTVAANQTGGCEASDLLGAVKREVVPTAAAVGMVFRHLMAVVNITITNRTASAVTDVSLDGTVAAAAVDFEAQSAAAKSGAAVSKLRACAVTPDALYRIVVVPQTATPSFTVTTANGKVLTTDLAQHTFLPGKAYTVGLTVEAERLVPTISGEVADWEPGGALQPGEVPAPDDGGDQPADGTMVCCGESYPTVQLGSLVWMAENLRYVPAEGELSDGIWYPEPGQDAATLKAGGMLYDMAAAQRLCPEGWRIPTEADFTALVAELKAPYTDFIPLTGLYLSSQQLYKYTGYYGYLMGATIGDGEGRYKHLTLRSGYEPAIHAGYPGENGVSVKYVQDAQ